MVVCWGGSTSKKNLEKLDKLMRRSGSVVSRKLDSLVTERRTRNKLLDILDNTSHLSISLSVFYMKTKM